MDRDTTNVKPGNKGQSGTDRSRDTDKSDNPGSVRSPNPANPSQGSSNPAQERPDDRDEGSTRDEETRETDIGSKSGHDASQGGRANR